jgi:hypothetical protein
MYTSIVLCALAGSLSAIPPANKVDWQSEYKAAKLKVVESGKPMAVFIGSGKDGWTKVLRDGQLSEGNRKNLTSEFVALYVDTDTAEGRTIASAFEIAGRGLVISDRKGQAQAFSHSGDMTDAELAKTLAKFAEAKRLAGTTEYLDRPGEGYIQKVQPETIVRIASAPEVAVSYPASAPVYRPLATQYYTTPSYPAGGG